MLSHQKNSPQPQKLSPRPPIVVVLGHVDHGKTTLLDAIRKTDVAASEYGGITQSIGAYQMTASPKGEPDDPERKITFIDTPGHEAFTKMRSQGAKVADIAVLVVAADDSVMPQTIESLKIIQEAKIPYIVAINKTDLPGANSDKVIKDLARHGALLENYGGDVPFVKISAKTKEGVPALLDLIGLVADLTSIKADPAGNLEAPVIEARLDKNYGPVAAVVVRNGTLTVGLEVYIDGQKSKIRALKDYRGKQIEKALPGMPAEVSGLETVPSVGAVLSDFADFVSAGMDSFARRDPASAQGLSLKGDSLKIILKADTLGSLAAITAALPANARVLESAAGEITEADILLARSTGSIVLGFNVNIASAAGKLAKIEKVLARTYKIIYELLKELEEAADELAQPKSIEEVLGKGEIVAEFPYEKMRVCGVKVTEGRLARGDMVKVVRGKEAVGTGRIKSLRVSKEEMNKVETGRECGVLLDSQVDFRLGDGIISYRTLK